MLVSYLIKLYTQPSNQSVTLERNSVWLRDITKMGMALAKAPKGWLGILHLMALVL